MYPAREAGDASGYLDHGLPDFVLIGIGKANLVSEEPESWSDPKNWDRDLTDMVCPMDREVSDAPKDIGEEDEFWYGRVLSEDGKQVQAYPLEGPSLELYRVVKVSSEARKAFFEAVKASMDGVEPMGGELNGD